MIFSVLNLFSDDLQKIEKKVIVRFIITSILFIAFTESAKRQKQPKRVDTNRNEGSHDVIKAMRQCLRLMSDDNEKEKKKMRIEKT